MDIFEIGTEIRDNRKAQGLSQKDLAERAGISRFRLIQIEQGSVFDVKYGTIMSVLEALDMTLRIGSLNAGRPTLDDIRSDREMDDFQP